VGCRFAADIANAALPTPVGGIPISRAGGFQARWSRDGKRIFYIQGEKQRMEVASTQRKSPQACSEPVFQTKVMGPAFVLFQFDVSSDSRFIVNSCRSDCSSSLTLLTGWIALLRGH
jgi:hypothetical protein